MLVQESLNLEFPFLDTVGFIPVQLCPSNSPATQPHRGLAFPFAPASRSVLLTKKGELVNASPDRKGFNVGDFSNQFKVDFLAYESEVYQEDALTGIA